MSIPLYKPFIKRIDMDAVLQCLVSDLQSNEPRWRQLVEECLPRFGMAQGIALRERRRAIELACKIAQIPENGVILTSVLTSQSTIGVLKQLGIRVEYIDCESHIPTVTLESVTRAIEEFRPHAFLIQNHLGYVSKSLSNVHLPLPVIEDISQSFGHAGSCSIGSIVLFDMEPEGIITCGGGTLLFVRDKKSAQLLQDHTAQLEPTAFMPDMNAVLGTTQLLDSSYFIETRKSLSELFHRAVLRGHHQVIANYEGESTPFYSVNVLSKSGTQDLLSYARKQQVEAALTFAKSEVARIDVDQSRMYPNAYSLALCCVSFPLYPSLRKKEVELLERVLVTLP